MVVKLGTVSVGKVDSEMRSQYSDSILPERFVVRTPVWARDFLFPTCVQTDPGAHPASCDMSNGSLSRE